MVGWQAAAVMVEVAYTVMCSILAHEGTDGTKQMITVL